MFYYIYLIPILFSAVAGLRAFSHNWPRPYKYFSIFLFVVLAVELFANVWTLWLHRQFTPAYSKKNVWIYNVFMIPEYLFYLFFYYNLAQNRTEQKRNLFIVIGAAFIIWGTANMIFVQQMMVMNTYSLLFYSIAVVYLAIDYFVSLLRSNKLVNLSREPLVWISIGAFFYHLCCIPYYIFMNYTTAKDIQLIIMLSKIMTVLVSAMYSSFTIAFLCRKHFQPLQRSPL